MSLVNKVLADLEARQGLAANSGVSVMEGLSPAAEDRAFETPRHFARINQLILIAALAAGAWTFFTKQPVPEVVEATMSTVAVPVTQFPTPAAPPTEAQAAARESTDPASASTGQQLEYSQRPIAVEALPEEAAIEPLNDRTITVEARTEEVAIEPQDDRTVTVEALPEEAAIEPQNDRTVTVEARTEEVAIEPQDDRTVTIETRTEEVAIEPQNDGTATVEALPEEAAIETRNDHTATKEVETAAPDREPVSMWGEMQRKPASAQPADTSGKLVNEARRLNQSGQIEAANSRLEEVLYQDPDHVAARSQLAVQWQAQGRREDARRLLEEGLQRQPGVIEWIQLTARIMVEQGEEDAAIEVLAKNPPQVALDPDYHAFLAALYQRRDRHAEAVTTYNEVLRYRPASGVWWMGLAISLEAEGRGVEALHAYKQAGSVGGLIPELRNFVEQRMATLSRVTVQ